MGLLSWRLKQAGLAPSFFAYSAAFEKFDNCVQRLTQKIESLADDEPYLLAGHSLGTTLIRGALPQLQLHNVTPPLACFFLAPPSKGSQLARRLASRSAFKILTGEMGQLLADTAFASAQAMPHIPTTIYAGTGGLTGKFSPFGTEPNDGILTTAETHIAEHYPTIYLPCLHTFIMNSEVVATDIIKAANS